MREIVVGATETPKKIENFLKGRFPIGYVRKLFRKTGVRINGRRAKPEDAVRAGDRVQLYIPFEAELESPGPAAELAQVIFEDDLLLVINKPAGLAVHEGRSVTKKQSLLGLLEEKYRNQGLRPQLVHRLDKDTSGVILVAKNSEAARELERSFETRRVEKEYLCLVAGRVPRTSGKLELPLPGRDRSPVRALTRYHVVKKFSEATLVRVTIETGRLHQIRLHFANFGHPVVMDDQHGDFPFNKSFRRQYGLKRQFLHAAKLKVTFAGKQHQWTAPLAPDLVDILSALTAHRSRFRS